MLGVDYGTFMKLTPSILNNTRNQRLEEQNSLLHLAGLYTHNAVGSALASAFGKKNVSYMSKPIELYSSEDEMEEKEAKRRHERNMANWLQMVEMSNQKFKR